MIALNWEAQADEKVVSGSCPSSRVKHTTVAEKENECE